MNIFPLIKRFSSPKTFGKEGISARSGRRLGFETLEDRRLLSVEDGTAAIFDTIDQVDEIRPNLTATDTNSPVLVISVDDLSDVDPANQPCTLSVQYHAENDNSNKLLDFTLRAYFNSEYFSTVQKADFNCAERGFDSLNEDFQYFAVLPDISVSLLLNTGTLKHTTLNFKEALHEDGTSTNFYIEWYWVVDVNQSDSSCLPLSVADQDLVQLSFNLNSEGYAASTSFYFTGAISSPTVWTAQSDTATVSLIGKLLPFNAPVLTKTERCDQVTVSWDAVSGADGYKLEYWADGKSQNSIVIDPLAATSYTVIGLSPATKYWFCVTAKSPYNANYNSSSQSPLTTDAAVYDLATSDGGTLSSSFVGSNDTFAVSGISVVNEGNYASGDFSIGFYASTDAAFDSASDILLGSVDGDSLAYGASAVFSSVSLSTTGLEPGSSYYIGWIVEKEGDSDISNNSARVEDLLFVKISLTGAAISGTVEVGRTLTATLEANGSLADATIDYQWFRDGAKIKGATGAAYTVTVADVGSNLTVEAVGTGNFTGAVTSPATGPVPKIAQSAPTLTLIALGPDSIQIVCEGSEVGYLIEYAANQSFTAIIGSLFESGTVSGLSANTTYYFRASAIGDTTHSASDWSDVESAATEKITLTGVAISGLAEVGQTLTATLTANGPLADATINYQWFRDGAKIQGAIGAAYTVTGDDVGLTLTVEAAGTDDYAGAVTSEATGAVRVLNSPTVTVYQRTLLNGQILAITFDVFAAEEQTVRLWTVDWGDGEEQRFDWVANLLSAAHYYDSVPAAKITLRLQDVCGRETSYTIRTPAYSSASDFAESAFEEGSVVSTAVIDAAAQESAVDESAADADNSTTGDRFASGDGATVDLSPSLTPFEKAAAEETAILSAGSGSFLSGPEESERFAPVGEESVGDVLPPIQTVSAGALETLDRLLAAWEGGETESAGDEESRADRTPLDVTLDVLIDAE